MSRIRTTRRVRTSRFTVMLAAALATSCAPAPFKPFVLECKHLRLREVTRPPEPLEFRGQGFSVRPPQGEHWCIGETGSRGVVFSKSPLMGQLVEQRPDRTETAHTFAAVVIAFDVPPQRLAEPDWFPKLVRETVAGGARTKVIESRLTPDTSLGTECVRIDAVIEESDNPNAPGKVLVQVIRGNLFCRHPHAAPPRVVLIGPSERYVKGALRGPLLIDALWSEVEAFTGSLTFMLPR